MKPILVDAYFFNIRPGIILTVKLISDNRMKRRSAYENHVSSNFVPVHEILQRPNCFIDMIIWFEINIKPGSIYVYTLKKDIRLALKNTLKLLSQNKDVFQ